MKLLAEVTMLQKNGVTSLDYNQEGNRFLEIQPLGMSTSRNFAGLLILLTEIDTKNLRLTTQKLVILQSNLKFTG